MSEPIRKPEIEEFKKGPLKGLTPNVIWLGVVSLLADISSEMLYPINPIFLQTILGAPVAAIGLIEGIAEATASLLKTYTGRVTDRTGKRRSWIFSGYILSAVSRPLIALASSWSFVLLARVLDRAGKGFRSSPRDALLADSVSVKNRGKAFGWHRGMDTLGAVIGPLTAIALLGIFHDNLRSVYVWAFIPGLIAAFFVFLSKEVGGSPHGSSPPIKTSEPLPKPFRRYLFTWGIFSIANSSDAFLLLRAKELGATTTTTILMYCLYNLTYALASPYLGGLSDRVGRRPIFISGLLIFAVVYFGFAMSTTTATLWILFAVYGLYTSATDGVGKALAVDLVPSNRKGAALGVLGTVAGLTTLVASSVGGVLWDKCGSKWTFIYGVCGALLAAIFMYFQTPRVEKAIGI